MKRTPTLPIELSSIAVVLVMLVGNIAFGTSSSAGASAGTSKSAVGHAAAIDPVGTAQTAEGDALVVASLDKRRVDLAPREQTSSYGMARAENRPPEELRLNLDGRDVVTIYATGDIRIGDGLSVDDAARDFWKKVGELAPGFCRGQVQKADQAG